MTAGWSRRRPGSGERAKALVGEVPVEGEGGVAKLTQSTRLN